MKATRLAANLMVGCLLMTLAASAAEPAAPDKTGLSVGQKAPAFTLKDQNDREVSLESLLKKGPVALVFYRSADWWPYCQKQLVQLQASRKEIEATGGQFVAISFDSTAILKRFATKSAITYPLLSDAGSKAIDAYGIRNQEAPERVSGIPHPGTFIVDTKGVIRAKLFLEGYKERHAVEALVQALKNAR